MKKLNTYIKWAVFVGMMSVALSASAAKSNLYAIIAGDTTDSSIGDSSQADLRTMRNEINKIQQATGLQLTVTTIRGNNNLSSNLWQKVNDLNIQPDDIVLFYYSGHGFRDKAKDPSPWPYLYFNIDDSFLDYEQVIGELKYKNPRFLLTIVDVCNSYIDSESRSLVRRGAEMISKNMQDKINKNYAHLFLGYKGTINITSSSTGEYSWGGADGGAFTVSFDKTLKNKVKNSDNPTWEDILDETKEVIGDEEHPYYELDLSAS